MTFVRAGEHVSAGQRILMYHNPAEVWVEANVKETEVARWLGMPRRCACAPSPAKCSGRDQAHRDPPPASSLLPNPNPSGNFTRVTQRLPLRIRLADKASRLKPGMLVEVDVDTDTLELLRPAPARPTAGWPRSRCCWACCRRC